MIKFHTYQLEDILVILSVGEEVGNGSSYTACGKINWYNHFAEQFRNIH